MTHDPLCPYRPTKWYGWMQFDAEIPCRCYLIAKVRADERTRTIDDTIDAAVELLHNITKERIWWKGMLTWCIRQNEAVSQIDHMRLRKEDI
jgi:hypothetical protein